MVKYSLLFIDIDECALTPSVCQNGKQCTNSFGGYVCLCGDNWTGPNCSIGKEC